MRCKRILSLCLGALLLLVLLPVTTASGGVYFTMVNSNAPDTLQESTMPVNRGGTIYVPLSVLGRLGVSSMRLPGEVTLFSSGNVAHYIHIDLEAGTAVTSAGNAISAQPVHRSGTMFFPVGSGSGASGLSSFFGINFRLIQSEPAPTARLYQQIGALSHNAVLQNGEVLFGLTQRYNTFVGTDAQAPPAPPQSGGDEPAAATPPPAVPVSLSFVGLSEETGALLDALYAEQIPAGFFLTAEDALTHPDLVRRLHGEGHQVGIFLGEDAKTDYAEASAALFDAARLRTVLVAAEDAETQQEAEALGLIVYETPLRREISTSGANVPGGNLLLDSESVGMETLRNLPGVIRGGAFRVVRFVHAIF